MTEYTNHHATANEYSVDLVICIDGTASMMPLIDTVKQQAKDFYNLHVAGMHKSTPSRAYCRLLDAMIRHKGMVFPSLEQVAARLVDSNALLTGDDDFVLFHVSYSDEAEENNLRAMMSQNLICIDMDFKTDMPGYTRW